MKAGKVLKYFIKLAISGILALIILSVLCLFYYNPPMPSAQTHEYSNYKYMENRFWVSLREGFGYGKTNELGYNDAPIQNPEAPRVAFLGSSHTVGLQIKQEDTFVRVTEELLLNDDNAQNDYECINLASAGQYFAASVSNLEPLAKSFDNLAYVVIEAPSYLYGEAEFERMLHGDRIIEPANRSIIYRIAQSSPYLRLLANQYQSMIYQRGGGTTDYSYDSFDYEGYERGFRAVAEMLGNIADEYGFKLILIRHSTIDTNADTNHENKVLNTMERCCSDNGIILLNMIPEFANYYASTSVSAYGFPNTRPNYGHLNEIGHSLIAQKVYETICEVGEVQ